MTTDTRTALLDAALGLFAEQGAELPSMREITRAADQRNTNALQYHFSDRTGLLRDLLNRHGETVDQHRGLLLDEIEEAGEPTVRPLAQALVVPLSALLSEVRAHTARLEPARLSPSARGPLAGCSRRPCGAGEAAFLPHRCFP